MATTDQQQPPQTAVARLTVQEQLVPLHCAQCAVLFAISARMHTDRLADHKTYYCPSGHKNYFPRKRKTTSGTRGR